MVAPADSGGSTGRQRVTPNGARKGSPEGPGRGNTGPVCYGQGSYSLVYCEISFTTSPVLAVFRASSIFWGDMCSSSASRSFRALIF